MNSITNNGKYLSAKINSKIKPKVNSIGNQTFRFP